jgi:2-dehydro-3-deoxyphosphooctonate aldolase (KDO 8-P synthase)
VVDVLQTPAFLCRQTDFIQNVARQGLPVNIKKGQFLAPWDMKRVVEKARSRPATTTSWSASAARQLRLQQSGLRHARPGGDARDRLPGGVRRHPLGAVAGRAGRRSGGQREFVPVLARAAVAAGIAGLFMETHPDPDRALSDGPNAWPLGRMEELIDRAARTLEARRSNGTVSWKPN